MRSKANLEAAKYRPGSIRASRSLPRLVLLPFFRDSETRLEKELSHMSSDESAERRKSRLYGALRESLERLREKG